MAWHSWPIQKMIELKAHDTDDTEYTKKDSLAGKSVSVFVVIKLRFVGDVSFLGL